jgi:hypothetical protein
MAKFYVGQPVICVDDRLRRSVLARYPGMTWPKLGQRYTIRANLSAPTSNMGRLTFVLLREIRNRRDRERLWNQLLRAKGCVKCDTLPKYFAEGPSGGMCTNVFCTHCGQGYNLTPIAHWAELIHRDERYVQKT